MVHGVPHENAAPLQLARLLHPLRELVRQRVRRLQAPLGQQPLVLVAQEPVDVALLQLRQRQGVPHPVVDPPHHHAHSLVHRFGGRHRGRDLHLGAVGEEPRALERHPHRGLDPLVALVVLLAVGLDQPLAPARRRGASGPAHVPLGPQVHVDLFNGLIAQRQHHRQRVLPARRADARRLRVDLRQRGHAIEDEGLRGSGPHTVHDRCDPQVQVRVRVPVRGGRIAQDRAHRPHQVARHLALRHGHPADLLLDLLLLVSHVRVRALRELLHEVLADQGVQRPLDAGLQGGRVLPQVAAQQHHQVRRRAREVLHVASQQQGLQNGNGEGVGGQRVRLRAVQVLLHIRLQHRGDAVVELVEGRDGPDRALLQVLRDLLAHPQQ